MQHIALLCSILNLTEIFCLVLQIIHGHEQTESKCIVIKSTVVTYLVVSKHHQLDRYDNSEILTSLAIFWRELKNENHKEFISEEKSQWELVCSC